MNRTKNRARRRERLDQMPMTLEQGKDEGTALLHELQIMLFELITTTNFKLTTKQQMIFDGTTDYLEEQRGQKKDAQ